MAMQSAAQAASSALSIKSKPPMRQRSNVKHLPETSVSSGEVMAISRMRTLWLRMTEIYGHRWISAYGADAEQGAGQTWAKGLGGITAQQLAQGLSSALASSDAWPPTLPEFRSLCLGIPTFAAVKHELRTTGTGKRSPFMRQVWEFLDGYLFARATVETADRMLRDAYNLAAEYVMRGGHLPEPVVGEIEQKKPEKPAAASPETAKKHMDEIAKTLGLNQEEPA